MSRKNSGASAVSSKEDIELTEFSRMPENPKLATSSELNDSCRWPTTGLQIEYSEDEADVSATTFLNVSDENPNVLVMDTASLRSLEDMSSNSLIRRDSPPNSVEGHSTESTSLPNSVEGPSTGSTSLPNCVEGPSTGSTSLPNSVEGPSTGSTSLPNFMEGRSTENVFPDPLEGPSTRTVWCSDSAEGSLPFIRNSRHSEIETNEISNTESPTERNGYWSRTITWLVSFLRRYSRQIRHSAYFPLFQVALLAIPCSAGYMSLKYRNLCRGCTELPVFMYVLAIFGTFIIIIRISAVLSRRYFSPHLSGHEFYHFMMAISVPFFFSLGIAMFATYNCEPDFFHPGSKEFCIKVFYDFAHQVSIAVPLIILLMCLINIPAWYDPSEDE